MSSLSFAARCPHCNHEFTVTADSEKIKTKTGKVTCSNCKQSSQIEGEGAHYLAPVATPWKADPPFQPAQQAEQKHEQSFGNEEAIKYEAVPDDNPEDKPERDVTIFDALAFFSVVLTGIVMISMLPVLLDNASLLTAYENTLRAFKGDIAAIGIAIIMGLVAGAIPTAIVVGITKLEVNKAANLLGVCVLCFGVYGYANSGAKGVTNSTWMVAVDGQETTFEIFENDAILTFPATDSRKPKRQSFKPITNDSEAGLFSGKQAFIWGEKEVEDSDSVFAGLANLWSNVKFYQINDQCLLMDGVELEEKPMEFCFVRQ